MGKKNGLKIIASHNSRNMGGGGLSRFGAASGFAQNDYLPAIRSPGDISR